MKRKKEKESKSKIHIRINVKDVSLLENKDLKNLEEKPFKTKHNYDDGQLSRQYHHGNNKLQIDDEINRRIDALLSRDKPQTNRKFEFNERYNHNDKIINSNQKNKHISDIEMNKNSSMSSSYNQPRIRVK